MGLPIKNDHNQEGCNPISSTCIIWQGQSIPCIDLCKGDSINDVTYKLATELCDLLDQTNLSNYDLSCFNPVCPTLNNFNELIQFIINKLCECCGTSTNPTTNTGCPDDCIVDIASCFYYTDQFGDTITQMTLVNYAKAIGVKVCDLASQIAIINSTLTNLQSQINSVQTNIDNTNNRISDSGSSIFSSCLISPVPVDGIPIEDYVSNLEAVFCELRTATGLPTALLNSILRQCVNLDTTESLNLPGVNMGSLPGWITSGSYSTVASSINNMWITICDMRAAVRTILDTCCPQGCEGLVINLTTTLTNPNLNFFWTGDGTGFEDCNPSGSLITITDAYGNTYTTRIPIVAYINLPFSLNLSGTPLNTSTNLSIHIDACFKKISDGSTCERCIETVIINQSACPSLSLSVTGPFIVYSFTNAITGAVQYDLILRRQSDNSFIDQHTIVTATPGLISGTFINGLLPGITYTVTIQITINSVVTNSCPIGVITTTPLTCNPPTAVSAVANPIT